MRVALTASMVFNLPDLPDDAPRARVIGLVKNLLSEGMSQALDGEQRIALTSLEIQAEAPDQENPEYRTGFDEQMSSLKGMESGEAIVAAMRTRAAGLTLQSRQADYGAYDACTRYLTDANASGDNPAGWTNLLGRGRSL